MKLGTWIFAVFFMPAAARAAQPGSVSIYYQDLALSNTAAAMVERLALSGTAAGAARSALHQYPRWANSVRFFHPDDAAKAQSIATQLKGLGPDLEPLDLTDAFAGRKVRQGTVEVWFCDLTANAKLPAEPYEAGLASWDLAHPVAAPTAVPTVEGVDPNDPYCARWDAAAKSSYLDRQEGVSFVDALGGPERREWVLYRSPAEHGHGAPEGACGARIRIYSGHGAERKQVGQWDDPMLSHIFMVVPGEHHAFVSALGDNGSGTGGDSGANLIIDDHGAVLWRIDWDVPGAVAWIRQAGQERLWIAPYNGAVCLMNPDGSLVWSQSLYVNYYGNFFSPDRRYLFLLGKEERPQRATVFGPDGVEVHAYTLPFEDEVAQKALFGLNQAGELALRVNRRIYTVDLRGQATQVAELPLYKGRHPAVETMRPGVHFDVGFRFGTDQEIEYATVIPSERDHPRPRLRFNINDFTAEESLDEGKTWHPKDIRLGNGH